MTPAPPLPDHLWNSASPELQAAILALVQIHQQRVTELESRVNDLEARLKLNSTNSSKPPSSDPIGRTRRPPPRPPGGDAVGNPGIARPTAPWSRLRRSAKPTTASRPPVAGAVSGSAVTTPNPGSIKSPNSPRSSRSSTRIGSIAWSALAAVRRPAVPCPRASRAGLSARTCRPCWPCSRGPTA